MEEFKDDATQLEKESDHQDKVRRVYPVKVLIVLHVAVDGCPKYQCEYHDQAHVQLHLSFIFVGEMALSIIVHEYEFHFYSRHVLMFLVHSMITVHECEEEYLGSILIISEYHFLWVSKLAFSWEEHTLYQRSSLFVLLASVVMIGYVIKLLFCVHGYLNLIDLALLTIYRGILRFDRYFEVSESWRPELGAVDPVIWSEGVPALGDLCVGEREEEGGED
jgi:hypothetical protein